MQVVYAKRCKFPYQTRGPLDCIQPPRVPLQLATPVTSSDSKPSAFHAGTEWAGCCTRSQRGCGSTRRGWAPSTPGARHAGC